MNCFLKPKSFILTKYFFNIYSGGIYKFDGESIDPIPITTDNLLSSSAKFSDDLVISGGKETRTYGISARTGQMIYECSMNGCLNATDIDDNSTSTQILEEEDENKLPGLDIVNNHDPLVDDVIVVKRQTQTVRAVETRTGIERWNFSVGQHELDIVRPAECHERKFTELDLAILDSDIKVVVPEGIICVFSKSNPSEMLWKYKVLLLQLKNKIDLLSLICFLITVRSSNCERMEN